MPLYDAKCPSCNGLMEFTSTIDQRDVTPQCQFCGGHTVRVILSAPMGFVKGNFAPFRSVVDGTQIVTQRDLREHNARNNVINLADGYSDDVIKKGSFVKPPQPVDKKEIAEDLKESIHKLKQGYVPIKQVIEDAP